MEINIGVEDIEPNNWVAWVFEFPGCYSRAMTREEAICLVPDAVKESVKRIESVYTGPGYNVPLYETKVVEEFRAYESEPGYLVNAFFENDRIPLTDKDIDYAKCLLKLNRNELISLLSGLPEETFDRTIAGEVRTNIKGILNHIGTTEWWYWDRLDMVAPRERFPSEPIALLESIREFSNANLGRLVGNNLTTKKQSETWSARKLLRRMIWHERVHTLQIVRYLKGV